MQQEYRPASAKPGKVQAIGTMMLINGILNVLGAMLVTGLTVLGTLGIGLLCAPITIMPAVLGVFEIIAGSKLISGTPSKPKGLQVLAILEIVAMLMGMPISPIVGVLNIIFLNDHEVQAYLATLPE